MDVNRPLFAEQSMLEVEECMYHIFCSSLFEQLPAVEQVCELNTAMSETKTRAGGLK